VICPSICTRNLSRNYSTSSIGLLFSRRVLEGSKSLANPRALGFATSLKRLQKVASSNSAHCEPHRCWMKEEEKHPFEFCLPCMHTVLPVEAYGRGNTNSGTVESPHEGTLARESHASVSWFWRPLHPILWERIRPLCHWSIFMLRSRSESS